MEEIIRIGMDTSKSVFQLHGVNAAEQPVLRKKLRRRAVLPFFARLAPTKIGIEACGGAHYWARELKALGHEAVLLPPQYVKPYVQRGKNDAADAEAICEAMSRPRMRFVPVKTAEQQAAQMLTGVRDQLIRRQTQLTNAIRGYAAEFGLTAAKGLSHIEPLLARLENDGALPKLAKELFATLGRDYARLKVQIREVEAKLSAWHRENELSRRLAEVPTIGPIGVITRAGDEGLRQVLVVGATAVVQQVRKGRGHPSVWLAQLVQRKPPKLAAVALANKTARIIWKLMVSGERYNPHRAKPLRSPDRQCSAALASSRPLRAAPAVAFGQP